MMYFNFIASDSFELDSFTNIDKFVDSYPDFQTVVLNDENELVLLLKLMGMEKVNVQKLNHSELLKYWDLSTFKFPECNAEQFDEFYENWIKSSNRDNNMDEYGQLIFIQDLAQKWNTSKYRIIVKEKGKL